MNECPERPVGECMHRAFGRDARLRSNSQLQATKSSQKSVPGHFCLVKVLETPPDGTRRAAFLISRRFDTLAVVRNRARRLLREIFRILYPELPPIWILFIPRRGIKGAKLQEVLLEVRQSLKRLDVSLQNDGESCQ